MIRLRTFGSVALEDLDGRDLAPVLAQPKRLALLIYLAASHPAGVHRRDELLVRFWPELDDARARDALNQALRFLRQTLGPEAFLRRGEDVGVDSSRIWCDAVAFRSALDLGDPASAMALYQGDFLQSFFIEDGGGFEEWMETERAALQELAARGARQLAEAHASGGAITLALEWGRRAVELAPDDERALRRLLRLHDQAGDGAGALRAYHAFVRRLEDEFGAEPSAETKALAEQLRGGHPLGDQRGVAPGGVESSRPAGGQQMEEIGERYRILRTLGAGGMATVYLALDVKHDREVALKVLRPEIAEGLARDRFLREIRIAGRLQHSNIVPLFDSGGSGGRLFYVMPHVQGETLRDRLTRAGSLPIDEVVHILRELASALAYAHGQGVIHRDIKPANILLSDRRALLTDFGIARAAHLAFTPAGGFDDSLTQAGISLGTPAYMSPEQVAASPDVDHRADLYALGVLGYEMLTGRPPFVRATPQEVLTAQLNEPPVPVGDLRADTPPGLGALLMRCLEKRAADRWQSANELLAALESKTPVQQGRKRRPRPLGLLASAGVLVVLALSLATLFRQVGTPPASVAAQHRQLTFDGNVQAGAISPDGSLLAYVTGGSDTVPPRLLVRELSEGSTITLAQVRSVAGPHGLQWLPGGSSLLFSGVDSAGRFGGLIFPRLGGVPRPSPCGVRFAAASPKGGSLACWLRGQNTPISFVNSLTHDSNSIPSPDSVSFHDAGAWNSTGEMFALSTFVSGPRQQPEIWIVRPDASEWHRLVTDSVGITGLAWNSSGDALLYLRGGELRKIGVRSDGTSKGIPEALQTGLWAWSLGVTADGSTLVYKKSQTHSHIWSATELGPPGSDRLAWTALTQGTGFTSEPTISPDGAWVAYREGASGDLVVAPLGGGAPRRLISNRESATAAAWSPDGNRLAFWAVVGGGMRLRISGSDGTVQRTYEGAIGSGETPRWAVANRILYHRPGNRNYHLVDLETGAEAPLVTNDSVGWMSSALPSGDGRIVAVYWNRKPQPGIWIISLHAPSQRLLLPGLAFPIGWSLDGRSIYVKSGRQIKLVSLQTGAIRRVISIPPEANVCSALERPAGLKLACMMVESDSDIWMIQDFDPKASARAR